MAARIGAWSARHRLLAILGWLLFVVVASAAGAVVGQATATKAEVANGQAARAQETLAAAGFVEPAREQVLVQWRGGIGDAMAPESKAALHEVADGITATGQVTDVRTPFDRGGSTLLSRDHRSALVLFNMTGDPDTAYHRVQPVLDAVARVQAAHPRLVVEQLGFASSMKAMDATVVADLHRAETLSIPLTFGILLAAFGSLVAALVPLGLALTAFAGAVGLLGLTSHLAHVDVAATSVMLLIGLAVGVDYSMFYLRRVREERAAGAPPGVALRIAAATSGRSVLVSGLTVLVAMTGMFFTSQSTFVGIAEATVLVVAVAILGSMTVLPAILSVLEDRVEKGRVPWLGAWLIRRRAAGDSRFWSAVLRPVLRFPAVAAGAAVVVLLVLAVPATRLHTAMPGATDLPRDLPILQTYARINAAFPGGPEPAQVVVTAPDVTAPVVAAAIQQMRQQAIATGLFNEPVTEADNPTRTVALVSIPMVGDNEDAAAKAALQALRGAVIPATVGRVARADVTGSTAISVDFNAQLKARSPFVFAFVLGLAFLLLLWFFRSVVIAATTVVLNLLSVAAAYGMLTAAFQWGWGEAAFGFTSTGAIASYLPLFLFVVLFGLSMDYHVFILSRIREAHDRGTPTREAIRHGIASSAGVITSAAVIMVAVFSCFIAVSEVSLKELGFGLAAAVLLDATLVRAVLVPAVMSLLGEHNWYLPRWLGWIPQPRLDLTAGIPEPRAAAEDRIPALV